ncbi:MAG TPA: DUF4097 family beta strand repeat-containing protein [Woeseiaceae bacterium]|nr:DUF4097 family beta strand repeat-containing protein [Woeseiaceae bacterium]
MYRISAKTVIVAAVLGSLLALPAFASVNKSVKIDAGATSDGASSVNGSVTVGDNASVSGKLSTVNGTIRIGDGAIVEDVRTVNGSIKLGRQVRTADLETVNGAIRLDNETIVNGNVTAVNGSVSLATGSMVERDVENVNGDIELDASEVGGNVTTVSGDVELSNQATIQGNLHVEKPNSSGWFKKDSRPPTIIIGPGSRVEGVIRLEREVKLYISDSASVGGVEGVMTMDDAVRFSGNHP